MTNMDTKEKIEVMQAFLDGKEIEWRPRDSVHWIKLDCPFPQWSWYLLDYRIKPSTPDNINWDHVHPDFKYMARDKDGTANLFTQKPKPYKCCWLCTPYEKSYPAKPFSSYKDGGVDWKDSLVIRPGCKGD